MNDLQFGCKITNISDKKAFSRLLIVDNYVHNLRKKV